MKKTMLFLAFSAIIILLSSVLVSGADAEITILPDQVYETTLSNFNLDIDNYKSEFGQITFVKVLSTPFSVINAFDYFSWTENITADGISWYGGLIADNVWARFEFSMRAPEVANDTDYVIQVYLENSEGESKIENATITVLNDDIPPVLANPLPYLAVKGQEEFFSIYASDAQTGVKKAGVIYHNCANASNLFEEELEGNEPFFNKTIDLSDETAFPDLTRICAKYYALDNVNNRAELLNNFTIDRMPPYVELLNPINEKITGLYTQFQFKVTDNLLLHANCSLYINDIFVQEKREIMPLNFEGLSYFFNRTDLSGFDEGLNNWEVVCQDYVGWTASDENSFILDKTPPSITVISPETNAFRSDSATNIILNIKDNYGLYSFEHVEEGFYFEYTNTSKKEENRTINTAGWGEGIHTVTIVVEDIAGNIATEVFTFVVDDTAPMVFLHSPANNSSSGMNVGFNFTVMDNLDDSLDCELFINDALRISAGGFSGLSIMNYYFTEPGFFDWRIECFDDAGNRGVSEEWIIEILDTDGPFIEIISPENEGNYYYDLAIRVNATDYSGVALVYAEVYYDGALTGNVTLSLDGAYYEGEYREENYGEHRIIVYAVDTLGYVSSEIVEFEMIKRPAVPRSGGGGSSSGGGYVSTPYCGDGICSSGETCLSCPVDCGECIVAEEKEKTTGESGEIAATEIEASSDADDEDKSSNAGIGQAVGLFSNLGGNLIIPLIAGFLILLLLLLASSLGKGKKEANYDRDWGDYFKKRGIL